jgi:RNA polymerase sigma-70 factor (ECF subfamily)
VTHPSQPSPLPPALAEVRPLRAVSDLQNEVEIVDAILNGHPQGAARLYDGFAREIQRVVRRMLGPDADHEDLVHEIFMKAWQLIVSGKLREPQRLGSWLKTIAVHSVYKEIRRRYVRRRFLLLDRAESLPPPLGGEHRDLLRVLYHIAEHLAPQERLAFSLRHFEQRRHAEVAQLMGCSLATAKRRLAQAEARFVALSRRYDDEYPALRTLFSTREGSES